MTFEGIIRELEDSTFVGRRGGSEILKFKQNNLKSIASSWLTLIGVIIQLNLVRHRKVMAEVRDSEMIQSLSAKVETVFRLHSAHGCQ